MSSGWGQAQKEHSHKINKVKDQNPTWTKWDSCAWPHHKSFLVVHYVAAPHSRVTPGIPPLETVGEDELVGQVYTQVIASWHGHQETGQCTRFSHFPFQESPIQDNNFDGKTTGWYLVNMCWGAKAEVKT